MFFIDAEKIRRLMFETKFSTLDLAINAGISTSTAAKVIHDNAKVSVSVLRKLADAFNVDGNTLILNK